MSDFLFVGPAGQHCWLELKRGRAPLTGEQAAFAEHLHQCGVPYYVARSYDDAVAKLRDWGVLSQCEPMSVAPCSEKKRKPGAKPLRNFFYGWRKLRPSGGRRKIRTKPALFPRPISSADFPRAGMKFPGNPVSKCRWRGKTTML
jgi:hypothetical protein